MTKRSERQKRASLITRAPILRIPNEITCLIFTLATSEFIRPLHDPPSHHWYTRAEIRISHVCLQWRAISLSLPSLWATIHFPSSSTTRNSTSTVARLDAYLERSGNKALDIWLDFRGNTLFQRQGGPAVMTEKVINHIDRWRQLVLFPDDSFPIDNFFLQVENRTAPNLELFCLLDAVPTKPPGLIFTGVSPKLANLWIDTFAWRYRPNMANITTLYIKQDSFSPTLRFDQDEISSIPNLTTLTLDGGSCNAYMVNILRPITTPKLKTLLIRNQALRDCLTKWKAPVLEALILIKVSFEESQAVMVDQLEQVYSFPNLRALILADNQPFARHSAIILTQLTSNVKELIISDSRRRTPTGYNFNYVFELNLLGRDSWPQLQELTLNIRSLGRQNPTHLFRGLLTRGQTLRFVVRLDRTILKILRKDWKDYLEDLETFCAFEPLDSTTTIPFHWPLETLANAGRFCDLLAKIVTPSFQKYSFD